MLQTLQTDAAGLLASLQTALPSDTDLLETPKAPSLLTLKNIALLSYMHHLILLTAGRLRGHSLESAGDGRGGGREDNAHGHSPTLVRNLIELRLVLEKIRPVESKTRTLVERLVRAADEDDKRIREGRVDERGDGREGAASIATDVDPLSFRPNLAALSAQRKSKSRMPGEQDDAAADAVASRDRGDGIYRPPRLAPIAYNAESSTSRGGKDRDRAKAAPRNAALLSDLSASMSANPYETSSAGVGVNGGSGANASARAKALRRMEQYEEENFTRLMMSKRDAKRRRRDEEDVALGGAGLSSKRGRVGAGLEEEFGDLLRNRNADDLKNVKRKGALQRSRDSGAGGSSRAGFDDALGGAGAGAASADRTFRRQMGRHKAKTNKRR